MPVTIKVNGVVNSLVHKGSNGISTATIPDVCKTPSPGGPVPIPYPNISQSITLASGTTTVKADKMMAAVKGSKFSLSNGDQAGTIGGVKSNVFMKESTWILYSFDVKMNGKNACRLSDKMFHNSENAANLQGEIQGPAGGPHSQTSKPVGDKKDSHHCPAKASYKHTKLDKNDGPAIKMDPKDHRRTASNGSMPGYKDHIQKQRDLIDEGKFMEAIQMDVDDITSKFPGKYDEALQQMLEYAKTIDPSRLLPR